MGQIKGSFSSHTQLYVLLNEYQNPSRASNTLVIFYTVRSNRYDKKYCPHGNGHIAMCLWLLGTLMRNAPPNRAMGSIDSEQKQYKQYYRSHTRKSRRIEVAGCFAPKYEPKAMESMQYVTVRKTVTSNSSSMISSASSYAATTCLSSSSSSTTTG